jgi:lipopolysaccharide transport system permease protein
VKCWDLPQHKTAARLRLVGNLESTAERILVIEAGKTERQYWRDLWQYRELFFFLAWRDVLVRYKQTAIGIAWSVIRPMLTMLVMTYTFGRVAHLNTPPGVPYSLLVFAGMLPWLFFANALSESSSSLVTNSNVVTKVYFPRIIVPTSTTLAALIDFAITLALMLLLMAYYRFAPSIHIVFLLLLVPLAVVASMGPGLLMSAMNVKYRDFRYIIPFVTQFGLLISPVGFTSSVVLDKLSPPLQIIYSLNPMLSVIDGFRWCILGNSFPINPESFTISVCSNIALLWLGVNYFRKFERSFADFI